MQPNFRQYMKQREQLTDLAVLSFLLLAAAVLMRIFYPQPFVYSDSYTYINAAVNDIFDIFRPNGYPHLLKLLHGISPSLGFLFAFNYIFFSLSSLLLIFSAKYILDIRHRWLFLAMGVLAVLSPRLVFSTNYMMSDGTFCSLAAVLVAACLWMIRGRSWVWALVSLPCLWFMCKLRYSGLFFIPAVVVVFFISFRGAKWRLLPLLAACVPLVLGVAFYKTTKKEYARQTGMEMFSGFGGWQKFNNALVLFPEAKELKVNLFPRDLRQVHTFMSAVPDRIYDRRHTMSTAYIWDSDLPPKKYLLFMRRQGVDNYLVQWLALAKVYGEYSDRLVSKYPMRYVGRYVLPSLWSMTGFQPFVEESIPVENKDLLGPYYGFKYNVYEHPHHFFAKAVDPVRRVTDMIYWIAAVLSLVFFLASLRKGALKDRTTLCLFALMLLFVFVIGGQAVSSPCTTWRYTMPFYQASLIFMFVNLSRLLDKKKLKI